MPWTSVALAFNMFSSKCGHAKGSEVIAMFNQHCHASATLIVKILGAH